MSSEPVRLQKFLAESGLGSRRACEELITAGRVAVDGEVVTLLGTRVDSARQQVEVDGKRLRAEAKVYLVLNKPRDVLCTSHDPRGRRSCLDLVKGVAARLYTVGRLDRDSEGLVLLTNDGAFTHALTHPRHAVEKVYHVWARGSLKQAERVRLLRGVVADGDSLRAESVNRIASHKEGAVYEVVLREGKNRQVRRMFQACGLRVSRLRRVRVGSLELKGLRLGQWRVLKPREVRELWYDAGKKG